MIKIGITGSIASGKSTVAKMLSNGKYPIFDADYAVKKIYKKKSFKDKAYKMIVELRNRIARKYFETGRLYLKMKKFDCFQFI